MKIVNRFSCLCEGTEAISGLPRFARNDAKHMNIQEKIEEIRRQPEHIRMRYVFGSVSVSMVLIGILWIFSLTTSFQDRSGEENASFNDYRAVPGAPDVTPAPKDTSQDQAQAPSLNEWIKK